MIRQSQIPAGSCVWVGDNRRSSGFTKLHQTRSNEWIEQFYWSTLFRSGWSPLTCKSCCWIHNWQYAADWNLEVLFR